MENGDDEEDNTWKQILRSPSHVHAFKKKKNPSKRSLLEHFDRTDAA